MRKGARIRRIVSISNVRFATRRRTLRADCENRRILLEMGQCRRVYWPENVQFYTVRPLVHETKCILGYAVEDIQRIDNYESKCAHIRSVFEACYDA